MFLIPLLIERTWRYRLLRYRFVMEIARLLERSEWRRTRTTQSSSHWPTRVFGWPVHEATKDLYWSRKMIGSEGLMINWVTMVFKRITTATDREKERLEKREDHLRRRPETSISFLSDFSGAVNRTLFSPYFSRTEYVSPVHTRSWCCYFMYMTSASPSSNSFVRSFVFFFRSFVDVLLSIVKHFSLSLSLSLTHFSLPPFLSSLSSDGIESFLISPWEGRRKKIFLVWKMSSFSSGSDQEGSSRFTYAHEDHSSDGLVLSLFLSSRGSKDRVSNVSCQQLPSVTGRCVQIRTHHSDETFRSESKEKKPIEQHSRRERLPALWFFTRWSLVRFISIASGFSPALPFCCSSLSSRFVVNLRPSFSLRPTCFASHRSRRSFLNEFLVWSIKPGRTAAFPRDGIPVFKVSEHWTRRSSNIVCGRMKTSIGSFERKKHSCIWRPSASIPTTFNVSTRFVTSCCIIWAEFTSMWTRDVRSRWTVSWTFSRHSILAPLISLHFPRPDRWDCRTTSSFPRQDIRSSVSWSLDFHSSIVTTCSTISRWCSVPVHCLSRSTNGCSIVQLDWPRWEFSTRKSIQNCFSGLLAAVLGTDEMLESLDMSTAPFVRVIGRGCSSLLSCSFFRSVCACGVVFVEGNCPSFLISSNNCIRRKRFTCARRHSALTHFTAEELLSFEGERYDCSLRHP